jgi:ABC-type nitrate/sulfonate/bicarbonate transport system substrate-binding protein
MKKYLFAGLFAWGAFASAVAQTAQPATAPLTDIKVSYQPALYWALPFFVATEKGWWAELGLKPSFVTYPAGVPQITAGAKGDWDVGGTGSVPAVLGFARHGLRTIGITNDESQGNALMVRKDIADQLIKSPWTLKGRTLVITANSTVDYAATNCLKQYGLLKSDLTVKAVNQADAMKELGAKNADLAGLWAPNIYTVQETQGARMLCSGKDVRTTVPGALVVRAEYAEKHPENVAKFLAIYLRGWQWMNNNPSEAVAAMKRFYEQGGVRISEAAMKREFETRPTFDLEGQLARMDRSQGNSNVDDWFGSMALYIRGNGAIPEFPHPTRFVTDNYMRRVKDDPKLRDFANNRN